MHTTSPGPSYMQAAGLSFAAATPKAHPSRLGVQVAVVAVHLLSQPNARRQGWCLLQAPGRGEASEMCLR